MLRALKSDVLTQTYLVFHRELARTLVARILRREHAARADLVARVRLGAQTLARLRHPNVLDVLNFDVAEDGRPFLILPRAAERTLEEELEQHGTLDARTAVSVAQQILEALSAAHALSIVHRSVRPSHVFVEQPNPGEIVARLGGFEFAQILSGVSPLALEPLTFATRDAGLPDGARHTSPETAYDAPGDPSVDIYGVGVLLYTMLTGGPPFADRAGNDRLRALHLEDPVAPSRLARAFIPLELDAIVLRALARSPEQRPASAAALASELARIAEALTAPLPDQAVAVRSAGVDATAQARAALCEPSTRFSRDVPGPRTAGWTRFVVTMLLSAITTAAALMALVAGRGVS